MDGEYLKVVSFFFCALQVFRQQAEVAECEAVCLSAHDLESRWQAMLDRWKECKAQWDKHVKDLKSDRYRYSNEQRQIQLRKEYNVQLTEWKQRVQVQKNAQKESLLVWKREINKIRGDLENNLFKLLRPSKPPFADEIVEEFNNIQCMVNCSEQGRLSVDHDLSRCPLRLRPPGKQQPESNVQNRAGFGFHTVLAVFAKRADYTEVHNKIERLFLKLSNKPKFPLKPSPQYGFCSYDNPEDCQKADDAAFKVSDGSKVLNADLHPGERAFMDSKKQLDKAKPIWMGLIDRVRKGASDVSVLESGGSACKYFDPVFVENAAAERNDICVERIQNVMTPEMLKLVQNLHDELMHFEQKKERTRLFLSQVRVSLCTADFLLP